MVAVKKGTEALLKFRNLQDLLGLDVWECEGLLSALWRVTAANCPAGDIGRFTDEHVAQGIGWRRCEPEKLMQALIESRWIEPSKAHRLIVHDWPDHCEDSVHKGMARRGLYFANGERPKMTRLSADERAEIELLYNAQNGRPQSTPKTDALGERTSPALPGHALPGLALPTNTGRRAHAKAKGAPKEPEIAGVSKETFQAGKKTSILAEVTAAMLFDDQLLLDWYTKATHQRKPIVRHSEQNLLRVFGAAERAIALGENPGALFGSIVAKGDRKGGWELVVDEYLNRASKRIARLRAPITGNYKDVK